MTPEQLIEEGRGLRRPTVVLHAEGDGPVAAVWYDWSEEEADATGERCWLTVDARQVPGLPPSVTGYLTIFTDEDSSGGRVEVTPTWPDRPGTRLYARTLSLLPPIEVVFMRGSEAVGEWLRANGWTREGGCPPGLVGFAYEKLWSSEIPLYMDDESCYAMLGGWHWQFPDGDWDDLLDEHLMVTTLRDSEPWVEAWRMRSGELRVIQRIT